MRSRCSSDDSHDGGVDVSLVQSTVGTPQVSLGTSEPRHFSAVSPRPLCFD